MSKDPETIVSHIETIEQCTGNKQNKIGSKELLISLEKASREFVMEKEYGGYLPLELSKGRPYYTGEDVIALNAGRYAITYAIEDAGWKKIYLPYWLCDTVKDAIHICLPDVEIGYYHIDDQLLPTLYITSIISSSGIRCTIPDRDISAAISALATPAAFLF